MNREIKFKAWDNNRKRMIDCFKINQVHDLASPSVIRLINGEIMSYENFKDLTLLQFIGLCDKNGKEICEGDILELGKWDNTQTNIPEPKAWTRGVVEFRSGAFRVHAYITCEVAQFCTIIGNVHENTELLTLVKE